MAAEQVPDYGWGCPPPHTAAYLSDKVHAILNKSGARTVLDAGCGNGALAGYLAERGFEVTGTDASISGIEIARLNFPEVTSRLEPSTVAPRARLTLSARPR